MKESTTMNQVKGIVFLLFMLLLAACMTPESETSVYIEDGSNNNYLPMLLKSPNDITDVVYTNGAIYTVNPNQPWAQAVAVRDGVILAVGTEEEVLAQASENPQMIDLNGAMMLPGFQDPHLHGLEAGLNTNLCLVSQFAEFAEYIIEIQDCAAQQSNSEWVRISGANMPALLYRERLPIEVLDEAVPDRPVIVLDDIGHGAWLNTLAMQAVGYDIMEVDPPGGILVRDPDTDKLTGLVLENAQQAVRTASLPPTSANLELAYQGLLTGLESLAKNGITTVSDAGGYWTRGHHQVWQRAVDNNRLTVRASNALYLFPEFDFDQQMTQLEQLYTNDANSLLRYNQVKIYVDGVLGQGTAALLAPYAQSFDIPGVPNDGFLYFQTDTLNRYVTQLEALGFQLHFHVTGDRGARLSLDAIQSAATTNSVTDQRHRLTHLYLVDPADYSRFKELGVVADFQLAPSSTAADYTNSLAPYLGDRTNNLLPAFNLLDAGAKVVLSSDWDADTLSPFVKIQSILSLPASNVPTLATVVRMMTLDVAHLLHHDDKTGSIEAGKLADLVVIDRNIFEIQTNQISQAKVLLTLLGGEEVYRDPAAPSGE